MRVIVGTMVLHSSTAPHDPLRYNTPMHTIDPLGRELHIPGPPRRIVSLVPSLTEYLFAIGAGDRLVGATDFCVEPAAQVAALPKVRGTKNPDRDAIRALRPDLVLAAKEENMARDVRALEEAGVPVYVTDIRTVAGALEQLGALARLLDAREGAAPVLDALRSALWQASAAEGVRERRRALAFIWRDPWMAVGEDNYADDLLRLCGAENAALALPGRYPRASLDAFMALAPEVILLPDEPYRFAEADWEAFAPYGDVPAVRERQVYLCDGKLLTWYGPRTAEALRVFGELLG